MTFTCDQHRCFYEGSTIYIEDNHQFCLKHLSGEQRRKVFDAQKEFSRFKAYQRERLREKVD